MSIFLRTAVRGDIKGCQCNITHLAIDCDDRLVRPL
jgi:hypothetical protein